MYSTITLRQSSKVQSQAMQYDVNNKLTGSKRLPLGAMPSNLTTAEL